MMKGIGGRRLALAMLLHFIVLTVWAQPKKKSTPVKKEDYVPQLNEITQENSETLVGLLKDDSKVFTKVVSDPDRYKLQIIFTQINRNKNNLPVLKHHTFNLDTSEYFFPASMVKVPTVLCALEKLNELKIDGLTRESMMSVRASHDCQTSTQQQEYSKKYGKPTMLHYIKDVFVASGNVSFDRLYEFVGQKDLNERLWKKGYRSCQITQRYGHFCTYEENRYTNGLSFYDENGKEVYKQAAQKNEEVYKKNLKNVYLGRSKKLADGTVREEPWDFTQSNFMSLKDMHEVLMAIIMPMVMPKNKRFDLKKDDYRIIHKYMSMTPPESKDPVYDEYYNYGRMKYILYGNEKSRLDTNIRIFNKVGQALGFLTDCAYIVDFENQVEFVVSATIYVNEDNVLGDGSYEYLSVGMPFLKRLGEILLKNERERKRKYPPNLDFFKQDYSTY